MPKYFVQFLRVFLSLSLLAFSSLGICAELTCSPPSGLLFQNEIGFVFSDGNIYSCERPGDDCSDVPIGRLRALPTDGGIIGRNAQGYVWSNGMIYSCARPGDDCSSEPIDCIQLPIE